MKKISCVLLSVLLVLFLSACNRSRLRDNVGTSTPIPPNSQAFEIEPTQAPAQAVENPTQAPASTSIPVVIEPAATPVPAPTQAQPSTAATASADLENTLNELEQLLDNMDTNVDVP
jgi:hypothetical protein